jgi:hypothetical protein
MQTNPILAAGFDWPSSIALKPLKRLRLLLSPVTPKSASFVASKKR